MISEIFPKIIFDYKYIFISLQRLRLIFGMQTRNTAWSPSVAVRFLYYKDLYDLFKTIAISKYK